MGGKVLELESDKVWNDAWRQGYEEGLVLAGREHGIKVLILDNKNENISKERIKTKLQIWYHLTEEDAEVYYREYGEGATIYEG